MWYYIIRVNNAWIKSNSLAFTAAIIKVQNYSNQSQLLINNLIIFNNFNNFCLNIKAYFLAQWEFQFIKIVSEYRTKYLLQQTKQTRQNKTNIFLAKINKVILSPIWQNLNGRSILATFILKMILSTSRKSCCQAKKLNLFKKIVSFQKSKLVIKIEFISLSQTVKCYPFLKDYKKWSRI